MFFCNILSVFALTIIVPKSQLNHRLTLSDNKPRFINSALNALTLEQDMFKGPADFTHFSQNKQRMCLNRKAEFSVCRLNGLDKDTWAMDDVKREVRFRHGDGKCVTLGEYNEKDDSFSVKLLECDETSETQVFILNGQHSKPLRQKKVLRNPQAPKTKTPTPNIDEAASLPIAGVDRVPPKLGDETKDPAFAVVPGIETPNSARHRGDLLK